jgi:AmiR/NasT family two-component response regulator
VAHIEDATNELVARYNISEHTAYQGIRHGWLNRVFELAIILCQPRP